MRPGSDSRPMHFVCGLLPSFPFPCPFAHVGCFVSILGSIAVSISACHAEDPGSIPGPRVSFAVRLLFADVQLPWLKRRVEAGRNRTASVRFGIEHVTITPQPLDAQMRHKRLYASSQSVGHNGDATSQSTMNKKLRGREGGKEAGRQAGRQGGRQ